jgi:uncharacterized protein (TIGR02594 family)
MDDLSGEVPAPWLTRGLSYLGRREIVGGKLSAWVRTLFKRTRFPAELVTEKTAWCAAFLCTVLEECGVRSPRSARARDFLSWGIGLAHPIPGSILVFTRGDPSADTAHVALCVCNLPGGRVQALGGNQRNAVTIETRLRAQLLGVRWPSDHPLPQEAVRL